MLNSMRSNLIDVYITKHECKKGKQKVEIGGKIELLESYLLPWDLLLFNHDNGRFNIEIQEYEAKIKRKLDATDKSDEQIIKKLLIYQSIDSKENDINELNIDGRKLYDDLLLVGEQREVAHITHDGIVVNGNRRMATIQLLNKIQPSGKWNDLWVVRLPQDISEKDLWKIEAGLQLSKEKVSDYGPVHNLLMISEGKKAGLSNSEIAVSMYGWSEKQVASDLERLDLINIFLDFFGQPNNYGLIKKFRLHEHFIDLQKGLVQRLKDAGAPKKTIINKLEIIFMYLRATILKPDELNLTHYDVRNICKILQDEKATDVLTDSFKSQKDIKNVPISKLIDNLDRATDVKKDKEDRDKPAKLVERAITALNGIDRSGKSYLEGKDVKSKLVILSSLIQSMKKELGLDD